MVRKARNCKFTNLPFIKLLTIFQKLDTVHFIQSDTDFSSPLLETGQAKLEIIYLNFLIFQVLLSSNNFIEIKI